MRSLTTAGQVGHVALERIPLYRFVSLAQSHIVGTCPPPPLFLLSFPLIPQLKLIHHTVISHWTSGPAVDLCCFFLRAGQRSCCALSFSFSITIPPRGRRPDETLRRSRIIGRLTQDEHRICCAIRIDIAL